MTALEIERNVVRLLDIARATPRVWSGLVATLQQPRSASIHGNCAAECLRLGLTATRVLKTNDPLTISVPRTRTSLTDGAVRELRAKLTLKELREIEGI